jgi:glycogen debranching enzyme
MTDIRLRSRANRNLAYSGPSLLETNLDGAITGSGSEGFYFRNTRLLSRYLLTANGQPLRAVAASPVQSSGFLAYALLPESATYVKAAHSLGEGMRTELHIENSGMSEQVCFDLAIHLAADFADLKETTLPARMVTGHVESVWDEVRQELVLRFGHPGLDQAVAIRVERTPTPVRWQDDALLLSLRLSPHTSLDLIFVVEPIFDVERYPAPARMFDETTTPLGRLRQQVRDEIPRLTTTNATVARAWQTATEDFTSLALGLEPGPAVPIAGLPAYQALFGREVLTGGWQALLAGSTTLRDALRALATRQGTAIDDYHDEEPSKILGVSRDGPYSILGLDPQHRYYGDYAAQPDFLIMLGQYLMWTDDLETVRELLPAARKDIHWLDRYGDLDGDGFLEYVTRSSKGAKNQGWKDSPEAIVDENGRIVPNPIATCELQGYWYVGLRQVALAFLAAGDWRYALGLWQRSEELKRRFDRAFWIEDLGFYALALDPEKRPIRSIASIAGQLLATGIIPRDKAHRLARRMLAPDMFSGWGIRTLSHDHVAYNPFSYHLGSVWPVENATFAFGFARYGCFEECHRLTEGLFALTELFVENRLPEDVGGFPRDAKHPHPGIYPAASEPQAWSASMIVLLIQSLLGIRAYAPLHLLLVDPHLPPWLPDLRLEGIQVGEAHIDLEFKRTRSGRTRYRVQRREGTIYVVHQPVPDGPEATFIGRALAVLRCLV